MTAYQAVLIVKFASVLVVAGGYLGAYVAESKAARKRAVHRIASLALLVVWLSGFSLLLLVGLPLFEAWIDAGVLLSVVAHGVVTYLVERDVRRATSWLWPAALLLLIVVVMVLKPTWNQLLP